MSSLPKSANGFVGCAFLKRKGARRIGASFLLVLFFAPTLVGFFVPKKTEAQIPEGLFVPVYDYAAGVQRGTSIAAQAKQLVATETLTLKETVFDMILFAAINTLLREIGDSVVQWIRSGFQGQPGFIGDPGGFMLGVGDQLSGQIIANLGLENFLCDPFQFPSLQLALNLKFGAGYAPAHRQFNCTILRAAAIQTASVERFMEGDFGAQGGWDMWADIAINNQNIVGAEMQASLEIDKRLASLLGMESNKLDWGDGFLSDTNIEGYIKTPGRVVENAVNDTFDSGRRRIEVSDEIDEIAAALIDVAIQSVRTGLVGDGSSVGFTSNYGGGGVTFSASDYEAAKQRGLLLKPEPGADAGIPAISGIIGGAQVYTNIANQGPSTHSNCPGSTCDATYAVDGRKAGSRPLALLNQSANNWWEADLVSPVPLNRLSVYNPTGDDANLSLTSPARIKLLDQNRNDITASFGCEMRYLNTLGNEVINNSCTFPPGAIPTKFYDVTLTPAISGLYPHVRYVRIEQNGLNWYLTIDEVEFFKRNPPVFAAAQSTSTGPGLFFNPYLDIIAASSDDDDRNGILDPVPSNPPNPLSATPLAGITYTARAPDGAIRPFVTDAEGKLALGTALGAWTLTYTATDKYGLVSPPLVRVVTVTQTQANAPERTPPQLLYKNQAVNGEISAPGALLPPATYTEPLSIARGAVFDVFANITARDADGTPYTSTSLPLPTRVMATYSRNGLNENIWNSNLDGTWIITYSFIDRFGLPASNVMTRTVTVTP